MTKNIFFILCVFLFCSAPFIFAAEFYLDSENGNDTASGTMPQTAWKTIKRLNQQEIKGGDTVSFKRGGLWREPLRPKNGIEGKPVIYGAYGEGEKPILQGSAAKNKPIDWKQCGENLWETVHTQPKAGKQVAVDFSQSWGIYQEKPADVSMKTEKKNGIARSIITVKNGGAKSTNIQFSGPEVPKDVLTENGMLKFRARASKPFRIPSILVRQPGTPWYAYIKADFAAEITKEWKEYDVFLTAMPNIPQTQDGRLVMYLGGEIKNETVFEFEPLAYFTAEYPQDGKPFPADVGNIVFDGGKFIGFKRWGIDELKENGDFWFDPVNCKVVLRCEKNPAETYKEIELCLNIHIISGAGLSDCIIRNLTLRYGGGHGIGGIMGAKRLTVEDCDIYFIGGGHLYTRNGNNVRYGNGIEWWSEASDCLVQRCRLWEIYDVAFTAQGNIPNKTVRNITMRDNLIWNCEQSFEYWRTEEGSTGGKTLTENVVFENNTCVDGGFGWSHRQRPDKRGTHFLSYTVTVPTNIVLRNNIFCSGANSCISMFSDWRKGATLYNNLWYQPKGEYFIEFKHKYLYKTEEFDKYMNEFGIDKNSILAKPKFVNPAQRDYRLAPDSPGLTSASDGGAAGIRNLQRSK